MDFIFALLSVLVWIIGAILLITLAAVKKPLGVPLVMMSVAFVAFFVCVMSPSAESDPSVKTEEVMKATESTIATEEELFFYAGKDIDLNNLDQYPWGNLLYDTLLSIGASDVEAIRCEVDSIDVTFKVTTETKRLWVSIGGKYDDEWEVDWIRNYDESDIYYYVTDASSIYDERLYSYETGEIVHEPVPGSRFKYPIVVSAEQLAYEISADVDAAKEKYNGKYVKITGRVTDYSAYNSDSLSGYYLYGYRDRGGVKIVCWQNQKAERQSMDVGRMCTCTGMVREISSFNATEIVNCDIVFE